MTPPLEILYIEDPSLRCNSKGKICNTCKIMLSINLFTRNKRNQDGYDNRCKPCAVKYYEELSKRHALANNEKIEKTCTKCNITKPVGFFYKASWSNDGRHPKCKDCHSFEAAERWQANPRPPEINRKKSKEWREANKDYCKEQAKGKNYSYYGVTKKWYEGKFLEQNGLCAICGIPDKLSGKKRMSIDHDHSCCPTGRGCDNCRRDLLCTKCNTRLGVLEIEDWVKLAVAYLKKHSKKPSIDPDKGSLFDF